MEFSDGPKALSTEGQSVEIDFRVEIVEIRANSISITQSCANAVLRWNINTFRLLTEVAGAVVLHNVVCFQLVVTWRANLWHWGDKIGKNLPSQGTLYKALLGLYLQTCIGSVEHIVCMRCSAKPQLVWFMKFQSLKRFWSTYLLPHSSRQGRFAAARIYSAADWPVFVLQLQRTKCFCTGSCIFWWRRRGLGCADE